MAEVEGVSRMQREILDWVSRDPSVLVPYFRELIESGEQLAQEWVDIWARPEIQRQLRNMSPTMFRRFQNAIDSIPPPFDPAEFRLGIRNDEHVTLLLGAGASAPPPSNIPTMNSLLTELWNRAKKMGREDIDHLSSWCQSQSISNIEDLLTAAYVANFSAKNRSITALLNYFLSDSQASRQRPGPPRATYDSTPVADVASIAFVQDTLQVLFGLLAGIMLPAEPNPAHTAITDFVKEHTSTYIITTNYDGCMDEALARSGVPVNSYLEQAPPPREDGVDLIKMHGSINWTYCDSCQEVRQFDLLSLKKGYLSDQVNYAVIAICTACGGQRRPLLVPPMAFKFIMFPSLIGLWNHARERIEKSDYIIVVGYSFSEADTYISKIISRSMTVNPNQRMIVCDPNRNLAKSLQDRFSAHIEHFDSKRIIPAIGSCDNLLPAILANLAIEPVIEDQMGEQESDRVPLEGSPA